MIEDAAFVIFLWAAFGLCAWNLVAAFSSGKVYVRWTEYARDKSNAGFLLGIAASIPITLITGGLALLMTAGLLGIVK